jgi:hypothetical protein
MVRKVYFFVVNATDADEGFFTARKSGKLALG